ncbi:helix-turn-helix domain-containing protein [Sphingomonas sp.]|uniref:helix-turn-helix domain-containing protein n=1 Tax=Sphingomonas sp. TaxID=28214 RepID=UPI003CC68A10
MDDISPGPDTPPRPERPGETLRAAREKLGLSLPEIASRTRVPLRHLEAIEAEDYTGLPSHTYATGFAKAYARAVGVDEVSIARRVRGEVAGITRVVPEFQPYEEADPARVPSRGLTIVALGLALALLVLAGLYFGTGLFRGDGDAPQAAADPAAPIAAPAPAAAATIPATGQVVITATEEVWVRLYDKDRHTLHEATMQAGDHVDVPADANEPMINVGRPDHLRFTINGSQLQGLDLGRDPIKDVRVSAAALAARVSGSPAAMPAPAATGERTDRRPERRAERTAPPRRDAPAGPSETQRANLDAARPAATQGNAQ